MINKAIFKTKLSFISSVSVQKWASWGEACPWRGLLRGTRPEEPCRCLEVLLNGLLLGAELEEVSSHDHGFEGAPCLDHVVLCERGLAFSWRLWARC